MLPGLKVARQDVAERLARAWPVEVQLLEVHLHPNDPFGDAERVLQAFRGLARDRLVAVHQPIRLPDGRLLDPAAAEERDRRDALRALEASAELAVRIDASFLISHPGGMRAPGAADARLDDALATYDAFEPGLPVLLENVPFWDDFMEGGRGTIGRTPDDLLAFEDRVAGYCLDVCHGWGAERPGGEANVRRFLGIADRILHVHASDAAPPAREGLPLGEGELPAALFADLHRALGPRVGCVPEILGQEKDARLAEDALAWLRDAGAFGRPSAGPPPTKG